MEKDQLRATANKMLENADEPHVFISALQELLKSLVDEKTAKNYIRLIPDTGKFYGVPKPILWVIAAEISKFIRKNPQKAEGLIYSLWDEGSYETKQIAGKSLEKFGPKHPEITLDFISYALPGLNNWSICDSLGIYAVEPLLFLDPQLILPLSENCIKSDEKWIRRFGVVSLRGYRKLKISDEVFSLLDRVMVDEEKDVKKAVSWIFRIITPNHHDEVVDYLTKWASSNPVKVTQWIIKDGMKKLSGDEQKKILKIMG
jgi:3-methyladenine DNA glycosylase AlkD